MTDYTKLTDFASKDTLPTGNAAKIVKGTELDDEFEAIETAVTTKANINSPTFTGVPAAPTAVAATNTTQLATTAMVQSALGQSDIVDTAQIVDAAVTDAKIADGLNAKGTRTVSTSDPTGGSDGDIWYKVSA